MLKAHIVLILGVALILGTTPLAISQNIKGGPLKANELMQNPKEAPLNENRPGAPWIEKWYGPDGLYENNGGFAGSAPKDLIKDGTGGKLTQETLSTQAGLKLTESVDVDWPAANGGTREWTVFEINPLSGDNMNLAHNGPPDNHDIYGIIVVTAPKAMTAIMSTAHDDHAQVWINGEKWYNNAAWTGAATEVDFDVEVKLNKGGNVVLFRVGESGGSAYMNMHFDDATLKDVKIYPDKANDKASFLKEVAGTLAVDLRRKLPMVWGDIKRGR